MNNQLTVEAGKDLIKVRVKGEPTEELLRECHDQLLALIKKTGQRKVLYDGLEMTAPPDDVPVSQWKLDEELGDVRLRRAIVVPDSKLAYLARLAFAEGDHKVFYNDLSAAIEWLNQSAAQ